MLADCFAKAANILALLCSCVRACQGVLDGFRRPVAGQRATGITSAGVQGSGGQGNNLSQDEARRSDIVAPSLQPDSVGLCFCLDSPFAPLSLLVP